jgi:protein involved in polysaccharide export with SLBB domain
VTNRKKKFFRIVIFFLTGLLITGPFGQSTSSFAQQPLPPTGVAPSWPAGIQTDLFPFIVDVKAAPGDTFVDLKWSPFWREDVKKPSRSGDIQRMLENRAEEAALLKEKQSIAGSDRNLRAGIEERERGKTLDWEKAKERIPDEKEIAGYIVHFGKDSRNYTQKLDVGPGTQYRVRGLSNYSTHFFAIQAYTKTREMSELSKEVSATPKEQKDLLSSVERSFYEERITQVIPRELKQFGYDFFLSKPSSFAPVADVPVGPDYVIGPGDSFTITLWGRVEALYAVEVDRNGEVSIPKVGVVKVWGLTFSQLQKFLMGEISKYYKEFQMNVTMNRLRTIQVFVVGEASSPGSYVLSSLATVYHALIAAGGPSKTGTMREVQLLRNGKVVESIDLYDFFLRGDRSKDVRLQSGDTVFIPVIGPAVAISGSVKKPAIYELKGPVLLKDFVEMAGGVTFQGYLQRVQVERVEAHQKKVATDFNLSPEGKDQPPPYATLLRDGDFVKVFPIYDQAENIVFLGGHIKRPGSLELKPGMKLSDLIPSYDALLSEPYLEHGEIQRLIPPDRRPETVSFHLGKMLQGDAQHNLLLQNQDRVIVFAKANFKETPQVSISGEVSSPGKYRLVEKMRVRDLVFQAGNVKRSAYLQEAEITRLTKTGSEVVSRNLKINLQETLRENPDHNLILEEDDHLFVRQIPKWYIDKRVSVTGEVKFPGAYTFYKGERLSSVLERAGGYAPEAYLHAAFFTRESVRQVQEKRLRDFIEEQERDMIREGARLTEGALTKEESEQRQRVLAQKRDLISRLKSATATGRVVIKLTSLEKLKGSEYDLELEDNDSLNIPPMPSSVMVMGRVYNSNAILYSKNKPLNYYLSMVGGPAENADKDRIYLVRADGSTISRTQESLFGFRWDPDANRWVSGGFMETPIGPGDTILVPEKFERTYWARELKDWTQILFQIALAAGVVAALQ